MNWKRPTREIKVKKYDYSILVDECVADVVLFIDGLPDTETRWACCGHRSIWGSQVEFISLKDEVLLESLILSRFPGRIERESYRDSGGYKGYVFVSNSLCHCSKEVGKKAAHHFGFENIQLKSDNP